MPKAMPVLEAAVPLEKTTDLDLTNLENSNSTHLI